MSIYSEDGNRTNEREITDEQAKYTGEKQECHKKKQKKADQARIVHFRITLLKKKILTKKMILIWKLHVNKKTFSNPTTQKYRANYKNREQGADYMVRKNNKLHAKNLQSDLLCPWSNVSAQYYQIKLIVTILPLLIVIRKMAIITSVMKVKGSLMPIMSRQIIMKESLRLAL